MMVALALSAVYFIMLSRDVSRPGLYYDEVLFVNAAVGGLGNKFVHERILGVPILLMPYIGALKAWIWAPIFGLWDVDAASVRLPAIVIGLFGNVLTATAMGIWFGRATGILAALVICFDPTVGMQSRLDWGPDAIMFACRGGFLLCAALAWMRPGRFRVLLGMVIFGLLGVFDKLSFLWIVCPGLGLYVVLQSPKLIKLTPRRRRNIGILLGVAVLLVGVGMVRAVGATPEVTVSWGIRSRQASALVWQAVNGMGAIDFIRSSEAVPDRLAFGAVLGLSLAAVLSLQRLRTLPLSWWRRWLFVCLLVVGTGLCFAITRSATGPHHAAVLAGLWQLPLVPLGAVGLKFLRFSDPWRT
jgi:hypothetical protein